MAEALVLIEELQTWIYLILGLAGLVYLRLSLRWAQEYRNAIFGLERDRAAAGLRRSATMLALVVAVLLTTFLVATFLSPSVPLGSRPTELPTVSLLASVEPDQVEEDEGFVTASPLPLGTPDSAGCANSEATITSPEPGETLRGVVEIEGTANIENFAFYKYEFRSLVGETDWQPVSAGTAPVVEARLGSWDTSLVEPGPYALRLVVTDTAGNAPHPCEIQIHVAAPE